jgi:hypothetical protein
MVAVAQRKPRPGKAYPKNNKASKGTPKKAKDKICANCTKVQPLMKQCARCKLVHYCCRDWKVEHLSLQICHLNYDGNSAGYGEGVRYGQHGDEKRRRILPNAPIRTRS